MYTVIELQTNDGITAVVTPVTYEKRNEAEAKFHAVMCAAAMSKVDVHSCVIVDEKGNRVMSGCYLHDDPSKEVVG